MTNFCWIHYLITNNQIHFILFRFNNCNYVVLINDTITYCNMHVYKDVLQYKFIYDLLVKIMDYTIYLYLWGSKNFLVKKGSRMKNV